jgi:large conductance mechanosensitive channel
VDFSNWFVTLKGPHENSLAAAQAAGATTLNIGLFLNTLISFVIVSFSVFWVVKALSRFKAKEEEKTVALTKTEETLVEIRDLLASQRSATRV